jgi:hypothetical protein
LVFKTDAAVHEVTADVFDGNQLSCGVLFSNDSDQDDAHRFAYAIWIGLGIVLISFVGLIFYKQSLALRL